MLSFCRCPSEERTGRPKVGNQGLRGHGQGKQWCGCGSSSALLSTPALSISPLSTRCQVSSLLSILRCPLSTQSTCPFCLSSSLPQALFYFPGNSQTLYDITLLLYSRLFILSPEHSALTTEQDLVMQIQGGDGWFHGPSISMDLRSQSTVGPKHSRKKNPASLLKAYRLYSCLISSTI